MTARTTVSQLVPAYCTPNADPASAGRVRSAFVAHVMFFHEADCCAVQVPYLVQSNIDDQNRIVALLCESYSRAVFESLFALHFDRMDPQADVQLLDTISGAFGDDVARRVHEEVKLRGVVIERGASHG